MIDHNSARNVSDTIVASDMCIGCGICAGICPTQALEMRFNIYGEYVPEETGADCSECHLCLRVCPFWSQQDNEDTLARVAFEHQAGLKVREETGYYLACYAGHSETLDHRAKGSSGGLVRWLLGALLDKGIIDYAVCVIATSVPDRLFEYLVLDHKDMVRQVSKSAYYPVEMSDVIRHILKNEGRYAVVGLPCFLKGLRLAMSTSPLLQRRVSILVGLVCGQTKSKSYAEYLCDLAGGDPRHMTDADFRVKHPSRSTSDYGFCAKCRDGAQKKVTRTVYWSEGVEPVWLTDHFTPMACLNCDDLFAEVADVACMDAWLSEYVHDSHGTSIMLCRTVQIRDLLLEGQKQGELSMKPIEIEQVIRSQQAGLYRKRGELANRLYMYARCGCQRYYPPKRVQPRRDPRALARLQLQLREQIRLQSRQVFADKKTARDVQRALLSRMMLYRGLVSLRRFSLSVRKWLSAHVPGWSFIKRNFKDRGRR